MPKQRFIRDVVFVCLAGMAMPAVAAPACTAMGLEPPACSEPVLADWHAWMAIVDGKPRSPKMSESAAIDDAIDYLSTTYQCGLSYTILRESAYVVTDRLWQWPMQEESPRMHFVGFVGRGGNCRTDVREVNGRIQIRRERKVSCPRFHTWLVRDDMPAVCLKD